MGELRGSTLEFSVEGPLVQYPQRSTNQLSQRVSTMLPLCIRFR